MPATSAGMTVERWFDFIGTCSRRRISMATKHRSNPKPTGGRIDTSPPQLLDHFEPLALKKPAMNRLRLRFSRRTLPSAASSLPSLRAALSHSCPLAAWTCSSIPRRIGDTYRRWSSDAPRHRPSSLQTPAHGFRSGVRLFNLHQQRANSRNVEFRFQVFSPAGF